MSNAPHYEIDVAAFWADPYPDLAKMRAEPDRFDISRDTCAAQGLAARPKRTGADRRLGVPGLAQSAGHVGPGLMWATLRLN
jgi:hypothetical protein